MAVIMVMNIVLFLRILNADFRQDPPKESRETKYTFNKLMREEELDGEIIRASSHTKIE